MVRVVGGVFRYLGHVVGYSAGRSGVLRFRFI